MAVDLETLSKRQILASIGSVVVLQAISIFGGLAVLRLTPGPVAAPIAATIAFVAVVGIAAYLIYVRGASRA